jgi:hypothetical protein
MLPKSEKISQQFTMALNHLDMAESILHKISEIQLAEHESINVKFVQLTELVEDLQYQICMPLEMEEENRAEEIRVLERRLAELKAQ